MKVTNYSFNGTRVIARATLLILFSLAICIFIRVYNVGAAAGTGGTGGGGAVGVGDCPNNSFKTTCSNRGYRYVKKGQLSTVTGGNGYFNTGSSGGGMPYFDINDCYMSSGGRCYGNNITSLDAQITNKCSTTDGYFMYMIGGYSGTKIAGYAYLGEYGGGITINSSTPLQSGTLYAHNSVKDAFNGMNASDKGGLTWGQVGWFCYNSTQGVDPTPRVYSKNNKSGQLSENSNLSISNPTKLTVNAVPGDIVEWTHLIPKNSKADSCWGFGSVSPAYGSEQDNKANCSDSKWYIGTTANWTSDGNWAAGKNNLVTSKVKPKETITESSTGECRATWSAFPCPGCTGVGVSGGYKYFHINGNGTPGSTNKACYTVVKPTTKVKKSGGSYSQKVTAAVGETIVFKHEVSSFQQYGTVQWGTGSADKDGKLINYGTNNVWRYCAWNFNNSECNASGKGVKASVEDSYTVSSADAGKTICRFAWIYLGGKSYYPHHNSADGDVGFPLQDFNKACVEVPSWEATPKSEIKSDTAPNTSFVTGTISKIRPGEKIQWRHKNDGNISNNSVRQLNIAYTISRDPNSNLAGNDASYTGTIAKGSPTFSRDSNIVSVSQDHVSDTQNYCQNIKFSPASGSGGDKTSTKACFNVPYHYPNCTPAMTCTNPVCTDADCVGREIPSGMAADPRTETTQTQINVGESYTFEYKINNAGPTKTKTTSYWAYVFILRSGSSATNPNGSIVYAANTVHDNANACKNRAGTTANVANCTKNPDKQGTGSITTIQPGTPQSVGKFSGTVDSSVNVGDKICSYLVINPWRVYNGAVASTDRASNIKCIVISKSPQLSIRGVDSYAKGGFIGKTNPNIDRGSWSQYGLIADSSIDIFGSSGWTANSATKSTTPAQDSTIKHNMKLDFANVNNSGGLALGTFGRSSSATNGLPTSDLPDITSMSCKSLGTSIDLSTLGTNNKTECYTVSGNSTINNGIVNLNRRIWLIIQGNLTINTDIKFGNGNSQSYSSLVQVPILNVIANDIIVGSGVKEIAGSYIAVGRNSDLTWKTDTAARFSSCLNLGTSSDARLGINGDCKNQLTVNGAIISAKTPKFQRTFGAGSSTTALITDTNSVKAPSEIINYQPNLFLVPYNDATTNPNASLKTRSITELPARY